MEEGKVVSSLNSLQRHRKEASLHSVLILLTFRPGNPGFTHKSLLQVMQGHVGLHLENCICWYDNKTSYTTIYYLLQLPFIL